MTIKATGQKIDTFLSTVLERPRNTTEEAKATTTHITEVLKRKEKKKGGSLDTAVKRSGTEGEGRDSG